MKPELLLSVDSERRFWLDPRTKLYMLVIFSIVMIDGKTDGISFWLKPILALVPFFLLLSGSRKKVAIIYLIVSCLRRQPAHPAGLCEPDEQRRQVHPGWRKHHPYDQEKPNGFSELGCYEFSIEDNGIGRTPEFQKIMFEPFSRADDHRTTKVQGTGLGMAIARNIVNLMNG
ncbi:protein containing ATP-binding region, ATPase-like domain protein, partial [human gut metagenome]